MIGQQPSLFPELETKHLVKDIDYVDISTLPSSKWRVNAFDKLTPNTFFIFKTGHNNPALNDDNKIYPYLKSYKQNPSGKVISYRYGGYQNGYPRYDIMDNGFSIKAYVHNLVALAFIVNDMPDKKKIVDHIDGNMHNYHPDNLRWVTFSENSKPKRK
tara:strand:- start:83 stop:556 length:474 start_codon:yes stop_codon:yes gene_type:complete